MSKSACSLHGCPHPVEAKALCRLHYRRQLATGDPGPVGLVHHPKGSRTCTIVSCEKPYFCGGYCAGHYERVRRTGDSGEATPLRAYGGQATYHDGYRIVWDTEHKTQVREHRLVMERQLGRRLFPHETVHHKNGVRDFKLFDNLSLWDA